MVTPEELDGIDVETFDLLLPMCETPPRLQRLTALSTSAAAMIVNDPRAVLRCYRTAMAPALAAADGLSFPPSELRATADGPGDPPSGVAAPHGWWIKRGDVHQTTDRDVVHACSWADVARIVMDFADRGIHDWLVQPHREGDLIKFYGAGPDHWLTWFHHDQTRARRYPFDVDSLARQASVAAHALGLEVFGGDAIVGADGAITIIDVNSWPSCARVRAEAAVQISWYLQRRLRGTEERS